MAMAAAKTIDPPPANSTPRKSQHQKFIKTFQEKEGLGYAILAILFQLKVSSRYFSGDQAMAHTDRIKKNSSLQHCCISMQLNICKTIALCYHN